MHHVLRILTLIAFACVAVPAQAEPRIALVVGNANYARVTPLDNTANDAGLMSQSLQEMGFEVTTLIDATQAEMRSGIVQFGRALRDAGPDATGLFYYAGHGVQSFGANYLLPVDVSLQDAADLDLAGVEAQAVLRQMFSARNATNIVILDACRNNPFSTIPEFNESGLAEMKAPTGTFLAYATSPGSVALDGLEGNSPFTKALAREMLQPGLPIEQVFKQVRVAVLEQTGGKQTPWDTSSLTRDFAFVPGHVATAEELAEEQFWLAAKASGDTVQVMLFLRAYPGGRYEAEAREFLNAAMLKELGGTPPAATAPAGPSAEEQAAFEAATAAATVEAYEHFLAAYPAGTFSEFVAGEIATLRAGSGQDPVGEGVTPPPAPAAEAEQPVPSGDVTFDTPLASGDDAIRGKTLAELIKGSPLFPPFEGVPEAMWKGQQCSNCHSWEKANLCDQAKTYLTANFERALNLEHPYGGSFKLNLKAWAANDCR